MQKIINACFSSFLQWKRSISLLLREGEFRYLVRYQLRPEIRFTWFCGLKTTLRFQCTGKFVNAISRQKQTKIVIASWIQLQFRCSWQAIVECTTLERARNFRFTCQIQCKHRSSDFRYRGESLWQLFIELCLKSDDFSASGHSTTRRRHLQMSRWLSYESNTKF